jgi:hypothetical protein
MPEDLDPQTETQVDPRDEELTRLRALASQFQPLESIREALDANPEKIYALQAALRGETQQAPQRPVQEQNRQLSPEEIRELNARALSNPAEFMAAVAQQAVNNGLARLGQEATPYMTTTAELFIETFKNGKSSDPLYKQIVPHFEKELRDINKQTLLSMAEGERRRALELRWQSASAAVFRKAAEGKQSPQNLGGGSGGGGGSAPQKKQTAFERDPGVAALTQRLIDQGLLSKEDIDNSEREIEEENS